VKLTTEQIKFIKQLQTAGIEFSIGLVDGYYSLTAEKLVSFLTDPDLYGAKVHNINKEQYIAWREFVSNPHCYATTKKGTPCKSFVNNSISAGAFVPGVSEYCAHHQKGYST
jgi:hypothetical protein